MAEIISPDDLMLPSERERQQIFYLLKKNSSITAWRRVHDFYTAWVDVTRQSLHEAARQGWALKTSLPASTLAFLQEGLAQFAKAMAALEKNNFREFGAPSFFDLIAARNRLTIELDRVRRVDEGENGIDEAHTPLWQEYCEAMHGAYDAWAECSMHLYQRNYFPGGPWYYHRWLKRDLPLMHFPADMEAVPDPAVNSFVRGDGVVACAGIWEPVAAPASSFIDRLTGAWKPGPPFTVVGAMNYFTANSLAPAIMLQRDGDHASEKLALAWRLLWREDRYADGAVPEQEARYRFLEPERSRPVASCVDPAGGVIWACSGAAAPVSGKWLLESHGTFTQMRKQGQRMPFSQGESVRWVLVRPDSLFKP